MGIDIAAERKRQAAIKEKEAQRIAKREARAAAQAERQARLAEAARLREERKTKSLASHIGEAVFEEVKGQPVTCMQCGGAMKKTRKTESSSVGQLLGCASFFLGIGLLFLFPLGTIAGFFVILASIGMGAKTFPVWRCKNCGYYFKR